MSETGFGTWTVPESPVDIEYSMSVIEEIRTAVAEGFQRLARGGIEVGGILYGTVVGRRLRIMALREIACEHARGPTFHLSENDRELLRAQLEREHADSRLSGMAPVGWYLSHTRSEITLQDSDLDTYNTFFPLPWQVTMVIRPGRASSMKAGFFVREGDGTVKTDHSYQDFQFPDRLAATLDRAPRERSTIAERAQMQDRRLSRGDSGTDLQSLAAELSPREAAPVRQPAAIEETPRYSAPDSGVSESLPPDPYTRMMPMQGAFPVRRKFPWTVIAVLAVGVAMAIAGLRFFGPHLYADPIGLSVNEHDGQLQVQWNHDSRSIAAASGATIDISDGSNEKQTLALTAPQLASGNITYARKSGDVQVRMRVTGPDGPMEEGSRFLGNAPEAANGGGGVEAITKTQKDGLQDEVEKLRAQNAAQTDRIQRLERTLTILRNRLGIADTAR